MPAGAADQESGLVERISSCFGREGVVTDEGDERVIMLRITVSQAIRWASTWTHGGWSWATRQIK